MQNKKTARRNVGSIHSGEKGGGVGDTSGIIPIQVVLKGGGGVIAEEARQSGSKARKRSETGSTLIQQPRQRKGGAGLT